MLCVSLVLLLVVVVVVVVVVVGCLFLILLVLLRWTAERKSARLGRQEFHRLYLDFFLTFFYLQDTFP